MGGDKPALVDAQGRRMGRLRVSVTPRCNFGCVYCRPWEEMTGVGEERPGLLTFEEMTRVVRVGVGLGFTRVRLTGGEPLVRAGLVEWVRELRRIEGLGELTATTNGVLLGRLAGALKEAGLDRVNISLDSLNRETTHRIARVDALGQVLRGIDAAIEAGLTPIRLNAVVMEGVNDGELGDLARYAHGKGAVMRFIEYMPMGNARFESINRTVPVSRMREKLSAEGFELEHVPPRDESEPARLWRCRRTGARVGFISSMTDHFCGTCDRMRLTSEGSLRPCLHQDFEVDVRAVLRGGGGDAALEAKFREAAGGKWAGHRMNQFVPIYSKREMISIGG